MDAALNHREWVDFTDNVDAFWIKTRPTYKKNFVLLLLADGFCWFNKDELDEVIETWKILDSEQKMLA